MMTKKYAIATWALLLCNVFIMQAQAPFGNAGDHTPVELNTSSAPFGYYEYLPTDFDPSSGDTYALVLFYHGYGERGNGTSDLNLILNFGPPKLIEQGTDFDAILISPQNSTADFSASDFLDLYNYITNNYPIDLNRVYVTGLSSGGGSTWRALEGNYDKIAAAVPICGSGFINNPSDYLQPTPIWAFHNFNDNVIDRDRTITNVNRIADNGNSVMSVYPYGSGGSAANSDYTMQFDINNQTWSANAGTNEPQDNLAFTLNKDGGHNAWAETYTNQEVWDWMLSQSLNTLNVEKDNAIHINIYPNPTTDRLKIFARNNVEKTIEIYNMSGQKIYRNKLFKSLTIDMKSYASGVYFAKVTDQSNNSRVLKILLNN